MQAFRNMIKGWVGKAILAVVIVLFVLMGAEALFGVLNAPQPIASVNGDDVSQQEFGRGMELQRRDILSRMGDNADPSTINEDLLRERVIERLVGRLLMKQAVSESDFAVSNKQVNKAITEIPAFQRDGKFSQGQFERLIMESGYAPKQFIQEVGYDLIVAQLKNGLVSSAFATKGELKKLINIERQSRDIAILKIGHQHYKDKIEVTEEEILQYYDENRFRYKTEEVVKVNYFTLKANDFAAETEVSNDEIQTQYDLILEGLKEQEERSASHILVEIYDDQPEAAAREKIDGIKAKLDSGGVFAELAQQYSEDPGSKEAGGDLGYAGKGVYSPEFEDALFGLEEGDVSDIVQTEFGFHLVLLNKIKFPEIPSLEDKREEIQKQLKEQKAENIYYEKVDELKDIAFESGDLEAPAEFFGKEVMHSGWVKKSGNSGIFSSGKVMSALFDDEVLLGGNNTEVLEISSQESLVARVVEHKPASVKPLAEVSDEIQETLIVQEATSKATVKGQEIVTKLKEGASTSDFEVGSDLRWEVISDAKRRSPELGFEIARHAFKMPKATDSGKTVDGLQTGNDYTVIIVTSVKEGEYNLSDTEEIQLRRYMANQLGQAQFDDYLRHRRENASVNIRKPKG